jgi:hypothetical protein
VGWSRMVLDLVTLFGVVYDFKLISGILHLVGR